MNIKFDKAKWLLDSEGIWLLLRAERPQVAKEFVQKKKDRPYIAEIKEYRERRSQDANAYAWVLMGKIAEALHTTKDEVYLKMLGRYGVFTHLVVKPAVVERVKQEWNIVKELGEVTINGTTGIQLQCYFGSSTYDTKEMARLIDGIVSECEEMEIETMTPDELAILKDRWST